jgi:two-component system, chemotaxis family, chemotaxis protein CheY
MGKKILIVDDSPVSRMIVKKCLPKNRDFELFEAGDGQEALEKFKEIQPDVTFMDLTMPVMDGFQALEEIKKTNPAAVVIVLTADIQQKTLDKVMAAGAAMVIPKPPSAEIIEESLAEADAYAKKQGLS